MEVYLEPHGASPRLVIVSATDVARSLRTEMERQGRQVVLLEPRAERVAPGDGRSARTLEEVGPGDGDEVVFTDHDAPGIGDMLATLLRSPVRFIGVMGSRRHVAHYVEDLRSRGFGDEDLRRIRSPLGLDLGGQASGGDRPRDRRRARRRRSRARRWVAGSLMADGQATTDGPETTEHVRKNREHWERESAEYQQRNRAQLNRWDRLGWGVFDALEDDIHALGDVDGIRALELGCGACQFGIKVAMRGAAVTGIDFSMAQLQHAPAHFEETGVRFPIVQGNGERLPFARRLVRPRVLRPRGDGVRRPLAHRAGGGSGAAEGWAVRLQRHDALDLGRVGRSGGGAAGLARDAARLLRDALDREPEIRRGARRSSSSRTEVGSACSARTGSRSRT